MNTYMIYYTENKTDELDSDFTIKSFVAHTWKEFITVLRNIEEHFKWTIIECIYPQELVVQKVYKQPNRRRR